MNQCNNRVIYDQWPYMTMFGILEVGFAALREGIQIDRLLLEKSREVLVILQEYSPLTAYLQVVVQDPVFVSDIMRGSRSKTNGPHILIAGGYPIFVCGRAECCG
jgi:hypothetical protein